MDAPRWDQKVADEVLLWVRGRVDDFCRSLDEKGQPGEVGIRIAAEVNRERYDLQLFSLQVGHSLEAGPGPQVFLNNHDWDHGPALKQLCLLPLNRTIGQEKADQSGGNSDDLFRI